VVVALAVTANPTKSDPPPKFESPEYTAVTVWSPTGALVALQVVTAAVTLVCFARVPVHNVTPPALKVTDPVGVGTFDPPLVGYTAAW
jgi:hypothetical protein